jgi:hypothetical protein
MAQGSLVLAGMDARSPCPDCPATGAQGLRELLPSGGRRCAFTCVSLHARQRLPRTWLPVYGLALVRRGVVVREHVHPSGATTAVDAIGPGGVALLCDGTAAAATSGYAADDTLVCLCPTTTLERAVDAGAPTAGEILGLHAAALHRVERMLGARGRSSALARVAAAVCALADTLSPPRRLERLPASFQQRDLAGLLGLRHESVCRAVADLARRRALDWTRDGAHILDHALLETVV